MLARTQLTRKKGKLIELVGRLQWQKHTLVLQLNILGWYVCLCVICCTEADVRIVRQILTLNAIDKSWILVSPKD